MKLTLNKHSNSFVGMTSAQLSSFLICLFDPFIFVDFSSISNNILVL